MTETNCLNCQRPLAAHSWDSRDLCNMFIGPDKPPALSAEQEDAIYASYLGICVLQTMCRKAKLGIGVDRATDLMKEMCEAFPFIPERVGKSILRS